jgi:hypothetical protein
VGTRVGLDAVVHRKLSCPCRESNPGRSTRSPSLYRLRYPGAYIYISGSEVSLVLRYDGGTPISLSSHAFSCLTLDRGEQ